MRDLLAHYRSDPLYSRFPQETRPVAALGTSFLKVQQTEVDASDPGFDAITPTLILDVQPGSVQIEDGLNRITEDVRGRELYVSPANTDVHYFLPRPHSILLLPLPVEVLSTSLERDRPALVADFEPLHRRHHNDPFVADLLRAAWRETARDDPAANLFVDGAVMALSAALLRLAGAEAQAAPPRLDDRRLARAAEHVEASLDQPLSLGDMAGVAGLSPFHFNRAFKLATGLTPHQYVTARRVERAKRLLADDLPLAEVAFATGFASQSHFGQVFKAHVGATPGAWREAVR